MKKVKTCSWCAAVYRKKKKKCPECGYRGENLCNQCPPEIKGTCCYFSCIIKNYETGEIYHNIIVPNHPCKYLDIYRVSEEKDNQLIQHNFFTYNDALEYCDGKKRICKFLTVSSMLIHKKNKNDLCDISAKKITGKGTKTCTIYKERFRRNKNCSPISKELINGAYHKDCLYVKKYGKKYPPEVPYKVFYEDVEDKLNNRQKTDHDLMNRSSHGHVVRY